VQIECAQGPPPLDELEALDDEDDEDDEDDVEPVKVALARQMSNGRATLVPGTWMSATAMAVPGASVTLGLLASPQQ
jgi:hypothetical protein